MDCGDCNGRRGGVISSGKEFERGSRPGEKGGVYEDSCCRLDSTRGVLLEDAKDTALPDVLTISALCKAPSRLCILLPLFGVDLECHLSLVDRGAGRTRSVGFIILTSSTHGATALCDSINDSSPNLPFPFLLSLRLSRMPLEVLRFLTAGLRNRPVADESLRDCPGVTDVVV